MTRLRRHSREPRGEPIEPFSTVDAAARRPETPLRGVREVLPPGQWAGYGHNWWAVTEDGRIIALFANRADAQSFVAQ
jgi:hypothetical protein